MGQREDIHACRDMYAELQKNFIGEGLSDRYLLATAGVELFDCDETGLLPDVPFVLSTLATAEKILAAWRVHVNARS